MCLSGLWSMWSYLDARSRPLCHWCVSAEMCTFPFLIMFLIMFPCHMPSWLFHITVPQGCCFPSPKGWDLRWKGNGCVCSSGADVWCFVSFAFAERVVVLNPTLSTAVAPCNLAWEHSVCASVSGIVFWFGAIIICCVINFAEPNAWCRNLTQHEHFMLMSRE